jgi:hypothetical protein
MFAVFVIKYFFILIRTFYNFNFITIKRYLLSNTLIIDLISGSLAPYDFMLVVICSKEVFQVSSEKINLTLFTVNSLSWLDR